MKKKQNQSEHQSPRSLFSAKAFRRGSYSAVLCVVVTKTLDPVDKKGGKIK